MAQASCCCIASLLSVCGHLTRPIHVFDYCPNHSIAFVAPPIRHVISHPSFFFLNFSLSFSFSTLPLLSLYRNPSISSSSFAPVSSGKHREWCASTIPHISNEYLVIILSPQRLSVWLRLSLDSVTNGTASFSTAAIRQCWQTKMRCSYANTAQRDCRLMPQSDLHIYKGYFFKNNIPLFPHDL